MQQEPLNPLQLSIFNRYPTNYQSNLLTESRQEFTELEKKIVTLVVNQIGNMAVQGRIRPDVNVLVTIPYSELTKDRHNQVTEAAESLSQKRLSFKDESNDEFVFITPFPYVKSLIANSRRFIEIKMLADVVPHFAALGQRYTKYDLDVMLSLSSVYAQRMFEIVSMNFHIRKMRFSYLVSDLRKILNCPETYRYADFVINVLKVAQRELSQKANLLLDWTPSRKEGKRIVELEFQIKTAQEIANEGVQQDQQTISAMPHNELIVLAYKTLACYKLKSFQKDHIIGDMALLEILFRLHSEFENGLRSEVKNRTSYLVKSLGIEHLKAPKPSQKVTDKQLTLVPKGRSNDSPLTERTRSTRSLSGLLSDVVEGLKP